MEYKRPVAQSVYSWLLQPAYTQTVARLANLSCWVVPTMRTQDAPCLHARLKVSAVSCVLAAVQIDASSTLPVGAPQLMMSFIKDGQLKPELQRGFEKRYNFNMVNVAAERADIKPNPKTPLANADFPWHSGKAWQLKYELVPFHNGTT
eukprot:GHUV01033149.1.p1 GENE.GHUV01033149.1~~GHUV01033149.1.p1  ORF type:complete len:149 (-),score=28.47 GHUV01033149.1:207-653(-)